MVVLSPFSPGSVGPCRGEGRPDRQGAQDAPDQGVPRRSPWQRARALNDRIEASWIGDVIACAGFSVFSVFLFVLLGVL